MNISQLVDKLNHLGVVLSKSGNELRIKAPADGLDDDLIRELRIHKQRLLSLLPNVVPSASSELGIGSNSSHIGNSSRPLVSTSQERLWFLHRLTGGNAYNLALAVEIEGRIDKERLSEAFHQLLQRHEPLRTTFEEHDGECHPRLLSAMDFQVAVTAISENELEAHVRAFAETPFSFGDELPTRAALFVHSQQRSTLVVCFHHLAVDGGSLVIALEELQYLIAGKELTPLANDFAAWVQAERDELKAPGFAAKLQWWSEYLEGLTTPKLTSYDSSEKNDNRLQRAEHVHCRLTAPLVEQLDSCAIGLQSTRHAILLAVFGTLIARFSRKSDVAIGFPAANRVRPGAHQIVGLLANTLVLRCSVAEDPTFEELVRRVNTDTFEALARSEVPLDRILSSLGLQRQGHDNPLFRAMLAMQPSLEFTLPEARCKVRLCPPASAKCDLTLTILHSRHEWDLNLEYRSDLLSQTAAQKLLDCFVHLLNEVLRDASVRVGSLPSLADFEEVEALNSTNASSGASSASISSSVAESDAGFTEQDIMPSDRLLDIERKIGRIWQDLLGVERVLPNDDFFAMGGHSLLAMQLSSRLSRLCGINLPIAAIFEFPRLRAFAKRVASSKEGDEQSHIKRRAGDLIPHPLSFAQERLWTLEHIEESGASYNLGMAVRLLGQLDVDAMSNAIDCIVQRHKILSVRFVATAGGTRQCEYDQSPARLEIFHVVPEEADQQVAATLSDPFEIDGSLLVRLRLFALDSNEHVLAVCMHHTICDGWSTSIFVRELSIAYTARRRGVAPSLPSLAIQYGDFAVWQREQMGSDAKYKSDLEYWKRQLTDLPDLCTLPIDFRRPESPSSQGKRVCFDLPKGTVAGIRQLTNSMGATPFMFLLAAFAVVISRLRGGTDIVLGSPFAGRTRVELEPLIGCFINTLPLRIRVQEEMTFATFLSEVKATVLAAHDHQDVPFERIVETVKPNRSPGQPQVFQILFAMDPPDSEQLTLEELQASPMPVGQIAAKYDLNVHFCEQESDAIRGYVEFATELFEARTVERMIDSLQWFLSQAAAQPELRIKGLTILSSQQGEEVSQAIQGRSDFNRSTDGLVHDLFAQQSLRTPHAVALEMGTELVTYASLASRVNQLAHYLRSLGVEADDLIAVQMERSTKRATVLLSILTASAAYLPLESDSPVERTRYILDQAKVGILIVDRPCDCEMLNFVGVVVNVFEIWPELDEWPQTRPMIDISSDALAYVIYTSGTTGKPKGVMVEHRGVAHDLKFLIDHQQLGPGHRVLQVTEYSFDPSVRDLFAPLGCGATAVLLRNEDAKNPTAVVETLTTEGITHVLSLTPTMLRAICATTPADRKATSLQSLMLNGEPLLISDVRLARQRFSESLRIFNQYGPTEATMTSCIHEVKDCDLDRPRIPVGRPNPNTRIQVLDQDLRPVPIGVFGEVFIGGIGVARGYLGEPCLTKQYFLRDQGTKTLEGEWYRTGDIGRWLSDGTLDLNGRVDTQIKVRGNRVEIVEIEEQLMSYPGISQAAVAVRRDRHNVEHLVAFIVFTTHTRAETASLRTYVGRFLPTFMVPSFYVALDALPYTSTGKLNRRALPELSEELFREDCRIAMAPSSPTERSLADLWRQVLTCGPEIDRRANFFDVGGNSLLLVKLHELVNAFFKRHNPIIDMFRYPTIAEYAAFLDKDPGCSSSVTDREADRIDRRRKNLGYTSPNS